MYALDKYYYTRFPQIDSENGLIRQSEGTIEKTFDKTTGREKLVMNGTGSVEASELPIKAEWLELKIVDTTGDLDFLYSAPQTLAVPTRPEAPAGLRGMIPQLAGGG